MVTMRLSDLQRLVAEMSEAAGRVGNFDPRVELFVIGEVPENSNLIIAPMGNSTVIDYMAKSTGLAADRGDFCLALKAV